MRYCILVSHGNFADGMHDALNMMTDPERKDILSLGLLHGMSVGDFREKFSELVSDITPEDEILLFGDIIAATPLSTAVNVLMEKGLADQTEAIGGMNFPMIMSAALADEKTPIAQIAADIMEEASEQIRRIPMK